MKLDDVRTFVAVAGEGSISRSSSWVLRKGRVSGSASAAETSATSSAARYLCRARITEADWRLFTTLLRFDPVYVGHFKCNRRRIADYPNLSGCLRELYRWPGVAATCNLEHIKRHYYESHRAINPTGIVPKGPALDLEAPSGRDRF